VGCDVLPDVSLTTRHLLRSAKNDDEVGYASPMRAVPGCCWAVFVLLAPGCSRPRREPAPAREPPAPSAHVAPSSTPTTSGSPGPGTPPADPDVAPPSTVAAKSAGPPREGCDGLFDPPAGAVKLCDEHVLASQGDVHWTSWAVTSSPAETFRPYEQRARGCGASTISKPPTSSVENGETRLSVHDANESGLPSCAAKAGTSHPTVVVISTKHGRK